MSKDQGLNEQNENDSSMAALNAINKIADKRFQELQYIQQQFTWSTIYIPNDEVKEPTKNNAMIANDPRFFNKSDSKDYSYLQFVAKNNVDQQFIYLNENGEPNTMNINGACEEITLRVEFANNNNVKSDEEYVIQLLAGLVYLDKMNMFKDRMNNVYNIANKFVVSLCTKYDSKINEYLQKFARTFTYTADQIKKQNIYVQCARASFASKTLKEEYEKTKKEYLEMLDELYKIVKASPQMTLCYNNAGPSQVASSEDSTASYNLKQVLNCAGELVADDVSKSVVGSEIDNVTLAKQIEELRERIKVGDKQVKNEILKMIDEKIDAKVKAVMDEQVKNISIGTGMIIVLIILFIICFCALMLSIYNFISIKDKMKGKYIVNDADRKRLNDLFEL